MSETFDHSGVDSVSESSAESATPLDTILDRDRNAADVPASSSDRESGDDFDGPNVPLVALKRERERRRKMDSRVRDLENELQKYNDQKLGIDDEPDDDQPIAQQVQGQGQNPALDGVAERYNQDFASFTSKHGQGKVDAIEAALKRLTPAQAQEVLDIVGSASDPVERIHAYVKRLGLLDGSKLSIKDILESKGKQQFDTSEVDKRLSELSQREQAIHVAERRAVQAASRSEFVSTHGAQTFAELDSVVGQLIQGNHPAVPHLQAAYQASSHPAQAVAGLLVEWGLWSPQQTQNAQPQRPAPVFPSNFAKVRNVGGGRSGPAWTGPSPLKDIFDRSQT